MLETRKRAAPLLGKVSVCALSTSKPPSSGDRAAQPRHGGGAGGHRAGPGESGLQRAGDRQREDPGDGRGAIHRQQAGAAEGGPGGRGHRIEVEGRGRGEGEQAAGGRELRRRRPGRYPFRISIVPVFETATAGKVGRPAGGRLAQGARIGEGVAAAAVGAEADVAAVHSPFGRVGERGRGPDQDEANRSAP